MTPKYKFCHLIRYSQVGVGVHTSLSFERGSYLARRKINLTSKPLEILDNTNSIKNGDHFSRLKQMITALFISYVEQLHMKTNALF